MASTATNEDGDEAAAAPEPELKEESSFWPKALLFGGGALTLIIVIFAAAQLFQYGEWPPFTVKSPNPELSIGETGDFIGGWANSAALIWLVVVTALQYRSLNTQQAELKLTRKELAATRKEIAQQVALMRDQRELIRQQAQISADTFKLQRNQVAVDFMLKARPRLHELLVEVLRFRGGDHTPDEVPRQSMSTLMRRLRQVIKSELADTAPRKDRSKPTLSFFDGVNEIDHLLTAVGKHAESLPEPSLYAPFEDIITVGDFRRMAEKLRNLP